MRIAALFMILCSGAWAAAPTEAPVEVPNTIMPKPEQSFWFEDSPEGRAWIDRFKITINDRPVTPPTVATWGGATVRWIVPTPQPGDYFVSLHMVSGDKRPGIFGYTVGNRELKTPEFREPGGFSGCLKTFRVGIPAGQTETKFFLNGNGLYFGRFDIARAPEKIENPDGRIHTLAPSGYRTVLKRDGQAAAVVLLPPDGDPARSVTEKLAARLGLPTAPEPPLAQPFPAYPVPGVSQDTNLILCGVSDGGPLVLAMRRAGMIEADHARPGAGGYTIRTVARPFRGNANVIFLGSSDQAGLAKAEAAFQGKTDPQTGETIYDTFLVNAPSEAWKKVRNASLYDPPADGTLQSWTKRLSEPFAGYKASAPARAYITRTASWGDLYWRTGDPRCAEIFKKFIFKMQDDDIFGGAKSPQDSHMALYVLMTAWDRVEEAPVFTEADRLRIVNYLLLRCIEGNEGFARSYATYREYSGPVRMRHNHQTILGRGLMLSYLYFSRLYDLGRADMWKSWCDSLIENATWWGHAPEDSPNYEPGTFLEVTDMLHYQGIGTRGPEGTHAWPATMLRFAAVRDSFGLPACYGDCWNVQDTGRLEFFDVVRDDWAWPGAQAMLDHCIRGYRYVTNGGEAATPLFSIEHGSTAVGGLLPPVDAAAAQEALRPLIGLVAVPMGEGYYNYMTGRVGQDEFWKKRKKPDAPPYEKTADKIQYREAFAPEAEYLLIETLGWADHGHMDLGTLVQYCRAGRLWIVDGGYENTDTRHHSTLELFRDGQPGWHQFEGMKSRWGDFRDGPQIFEIVEIEPKQAGAPGPFRVVLRAKNYAGATWLRTVSGGGGAALTVEDAITAELPGEFKAQVRYRLLGAVAGAQGAWRVAQKGAEMPVALSFQAGDTVGLRPWEPDAHTFTQGRYPFYAFLPAADAALPDASKEKGIPKTIEWTRTARLKPGETMTFRAVLGPPAAK